MKLLKINKNNIEKTVIIKDKNEPAIKGVLNYCIDNGILNSELDILDIILKELKEKENEHLVIKIFTNKLFVISEKNRWHYSDDQFMTVKEFIAAYEEYKKGNYETNYQDFRNYYYTTTFYSNCC